MDDREAIDEALEILGEQDAETTGSVDYREQKLGPYDLNRCYTGDALELLKKLPSNSVHCCVTSPPYFGLRTCMPEDHPDRAKEIGIEDNPDDYIARLVEVFGELRRVLRKDGVAWINIGDTYFSSTKGSGGTDSKTSPMHAGRLGKSQHFKPRKIHGGSARIKQSDLVGIPFMLAFALREEGWYLRSPIIWSKRKQHQPESVTSRPTKAYEFIFMLTKTKDYFYDQEAIRDGGARKCDVWEIGLKGYVESHYATFPKSLPSICIQLGSSSEGCCMDCGKPWVRVTDKKRTPTGGGGYEGKMSEADDSIVGGSRLALNTRGARKAGADHDNPFPAPKTIGWQPSCKCEAGSPVPCVVLDFFAGSGTTCEAAIDLGRRWLGFDLDGRNARLVSKRTAQMSLLGAAAGRRADQLDLEERD